MNPAMPGTYAYRLLRRLLKGSDAMGRDGMVLFSSLLILASVSLLAFGLASDATTELRIAGNRRLNEQAFNISDGGANVGVQVVLDHLYEAVDPAVDYPGEEEIPLITDGLFMSHFRMDANLLADMKGYPGNDNAQDPESAPADVYFELSSQAGASKPDSSVVVDIDRIGAKLMAGTSVEFAAGYEGVGKGAGAGSVGIFYAVDSIATRESARSDVTTVYRKVSNVLSGAE